MASQFEAVKPKKAPRLAVVNVTLDTAGVLAPVQRAVRQMVDVVTFCLNAIEQGDLSGWPQTDLMRFNLRSARH
jgi:hypothetical protein